MSKVPKSNPVVTGSIIEHLTEDIVFLPNPVHRRVKSKFWARFDSLTKSAHSVSLAEATAITGESGLTKWWNQPGFKEWFLNYDEARERLEYLYMLALDAAESLLLDPEANANAKVQLIKVLAILAGKEPSRQEQYTDAIIQRMGPEELKKYIESKAPKLLVAEQKPN